jgi:hypothetical protein
VEVRKERKDVEKRRRDRKLREKRKREKVNQEWAKQGQSPLVTPETTPEPGLLPSASGDIDYSMLETFNMEVAGGQSSGQRRADAEAPGSVVGDRAPAQRGHPRSRTWRPSDGCRHRGLKLA